MSLREERLRAFFGAYFHQDWDVDGAESWEGVIAQYVREATPQMVRQLREDLAGWLGDSADLIALNPQATPAADACDYNPNPELTGSAWIAAIVVELDHHLGAVGR
jgi:hypothetical protein